MTVESELFDHLNSNWSSTSISWLNENVQFQPTLPNSYILPRVDYFSIIAREVPHSSSMVDRNARFVLNLMVPFDTGAGVFRTYIDELRTLYDRKDLSLSTYTYYFDVLNDRAGFVSSLSEEYFEVPVFVDFRVYET